MLSWGVVRERERGRSAGPGPHDSRRFDCLDNALPRPWTEAWSVEASKSRAPGSVQGALEVSGYVAVSCGAPLIAALTTQMT